MTISGGQSQITRSSGLITGQASLRNSLIDIARPLAKQRNPVLVQGQRIGFEPVIPALWLRCVDFT